MNKRSEVVDIELITGMAMFPRRRARAVLEPRDKGERAFSIVWPTASPGTVAAAPRIRSLERRELNRLPGKGKNETSQETILDLLFSNLTRRRE